MDPATLLTRCRNGDELAWEAFVRRYGPRVYGVAYHYVSDPDEAHDLAQEIFVKVYRKLPTCRDPERLPGWLVQVARHACLDHLRRRRARPPGRDLPADEMVNLSDPAPDPAEQWEAQDRRRLLRRALRRLNETSREILLLKDIQGLSVTEVASALGIPSGTVKSRSSRARLELAREILAMTAGEGGAP